MKQGATLASMLEAHLGPLAVALGSGSAVTVLALADQTTAVGALAGVLAAVVALLGWLVRRQQSAADARDRAARKERERDREQDREERQGRDKIFADLIAAQRLESDRQTTRIVEAIEHLRTAVNDGRGCRHPAPAHHGA